MLQTGEVVTTHKGQLDEVQCDKRWIRTRNQMSTENDCDISLDQLFPRDSFTLSYTL